VVGPRAHPRHVLTMLRIWVSLLLAFCLVSSQQGALLHELGHYAARAEGLQGVEAQAHAAGAMCDVCFAFEHIAGAVATPLLVAAFLSTEDHWIATERFALLAAAPPQASARGPPVS